MKLGRVARLGYTFTLAVGLAVAAGPPRLHLTNEGLSIDYPWWRGASALLAALAVWLLARTTPRRWLKWPGIAGTVLTAAFGFSRLLFRLDAGKDALSLRALLAVTAIPWREVSRVEQGPAMLVITGSGEAQILLRTGDFGRDQQASLERAIARRVREAQSLPSPR